MPAPADRCRGGGSAPVRGRRQSSPRPGSTTGSARYAAHSRASASSVAVMAGGVPTSNHSPWWTVPKQRPSSIARSHRMLVENGPSGASSQQALRHDLDRRCRRRARRGPRPRRRSRPDAVHVEIADALVIAGARLRHQQQQRVHLRSASHCEASSFSVSPGPSTQKLSLLIARNGSQSIIGSRAGPGRRRSPAAARVRHR